MALAQPKGGQPLPEKTYSEEIQELKGKISELESQLKTQSEKAPGLMQELLLKDLIRLLENDQIDKKITLLRAKGVWKFMIDFQNGQLANDKDLSDNLKKIDQISGDSGKEKPVEVL